MAFVRVAVDHGAAGVPLSLGAPGIPGSPAASVRTPTRFRSNSRLPGKAFLGAILPREQQIVESRDRTVMQIGRFVAQTPFSGRACCRHHRCRSEDLLPGNSSFRR